MTTKRIVTALLLAVLTLSFFSVNAIAKGGPGGGGGGGGDILDTGELYGDLYVVRRDADGVPELDDNGCVQPIAADGTVLELYTNEAEDIYCEVTEELALLVQTVDFGRLNEGRAPDAVIAHAFDEAINAMNAATAISQDPAGRILLTIDGEFKTIDSPLENLGLYITMMKDGDWLTPENTPTVTQGGRSSDKGPSGDDGPTTEMRPVLSSDAKAMLSALGYGALVTEGGTLGNNDLLLAASLLAAAGDKTGTITLDMVMYINSIYGINQLGSLEVNGNSYFDFRGFSYGRDGVYGQRGSSECNAGSVWVLTLLDPNDTTLWQADCMVLLDEVHHFRGNETENVRGFAQAADDALQVIEYIHNYRVPEILPILP